MILSNKLVSKLENSLISNPNYLLLLTFFNCAILLNFHKMIWRNPLLIIVFFSLVLLSLINYKFWWATIITTITSSFLFAKHFPRQANHSNIEFFIGLIILTLLAFKIANSKFKISGNLVSYVFRIFVVSFYFYTGFHKLNTDFFNPCVSCVNEVNEYILENLLGQKIVLSSKISVFFQYATIFIEMVLPFGLFWHKTRKLTAIILLLFHWYLNFAVYIDFSSLAAFLILGSILDFENINSKSQIFKSVSFYVFFTLLSIIVKLILIRLSINSFYFGFVCGFVFNIGWVIFFYSFFKNHKERVYHFEKRYTLILTVCFLATSFWTLKGYVGLGNAGNFTMFSNLMTEKNRSNHFLIDTKKTKLFDYEEDSVLILKLHDTLKREKLEQYKLPLIEFNYLSKKWVEKYPKLEINATIVYKNDTLVVRSLKDSKFTATKWRYKYLFFRKIQPQGASNCVW